MSVRGQIFENPVTGERAVVRVGTEETGGKRLVADLYVSPGGRVAAEHVHPTIEESFTVIGGKVGFRINGRESVAEVGKRLRVPPGTTHDWWNAGSKEAHVLVEVSPGVRFEEAIANLWGLAHDGKTNDRGMPNLLQLALIAREFEDVLYFTNPPRFAQKALFGILAPIARLLGYKGSYPEYTRSTARAQRETTHG